MNIYAKEGDKVVFSFPQNGDYYDKEQAKRHLIVGETYTIKKTNVGRWYTEVWLKEIPGVSFNSVQFEDALASKSEG